MNDISGAASSRAGGAPSYRHHAVALRIRPVCDRCQSGLIAPGASVYLQQSPGYPVSQRLSHQNERQIRKSKHHQDRDRC
jgi:hypothetical protein